MLAHFRRLLITIAWLIRQLCDVTWFLINLVAVSLTGVHFFYQAITYDISSSRSKEKNIVCNDEQELVAHDSDVAPIVLVHGFFGFGEGKMGGLPYFGGIENMYPRIFSPDLGSLTSLYDRARQLFYYLKGGQVDYGEEHSKAYGHSQFGRVYKQGKYTEWNEDNPVHFVGHSAGAQVVRLLHQMLANKAFKGHDDTNAKWIASITTLSGSLNGSTLTYIYGMKPDDWRFAKTISPLGLLCLAVTIYDWLDIPWLKRYYNFGFDHFHLTRKKLGLGGLVDCLSGNSGPFVSSDWVVPDLTIQGSVQINSQLNTFPDTFYFSYASKATKKVKGKVVPMKLKGGRAWYRIQGTWLCKWCYPKNVQIPYDEYRDEDWWDSDCQLNTISMTHPHLPSKHPHCFIVDGSTFEPQPGLWYCEMVEAYHIQFVFSIEKETHIYHLYDKIFKRCRNLNTKRNSIQSVT